MKTIIMVLFLLIGISVNAQQNYNLGDTIRVDNDLTLIVTNVDHAYVMDIKTQNMEFPCNPEIPDYAIGLIGGSGFTPPLSGEIAKTIMQIFNEVFTKDELYYFVKNATEYTGEGIGFWISVDLNGNIVLLKMTFSPNNLTIDSIPKDKIGKLYKLMVDRVKFNIRNTGLEYYLLNLRVKFKDVVNGTLDFSNLMRDIKGGYMNYYWKDGELHKFE